MGPPSSKSVVPPGWTINVRSAAFAAIAFAAAAALFAFLHRAGPQHKLWTPAQGIIQDARIVPDYALETKSGGHVTWKAEYKVAYSVDSHDYVVWADSGVRAESEAGVAMVLRQSHPSCRVQYNPKDQRCRLQFADDFTRLSSSLLMDSITNPGFARRAKTDRDNREAGR